MNSVLNTSALSKLKNHPQITQKLCNLWMACVASQVF